MKELAMTPHTLIVLILGMLCACGGSLHERERTATEQKGSRLAPRVAPSSWKGPALVLTNEPLPPRWFQPSRHGLTAAPAAFASFATATDVEVTEAQVAAALANHGLSLARFERFGNSWVVECGFGN